jgi:stress response protein YsnF
MSQDEADYYQQEFEAGHSIVMVESHGDQQEARAILQRYGAYDASRTGTSHSPYDVDRTGTSHDPHDADRTGTSQRPYDAGHNPYDTGHSSYEQIGDNLTISLHEEVLLAHKHSVQIDEVIIRKEVITEEKTITVPIRREELVIEHLPASDQPSDQSQQEDQLGRDRSDNSDLPHKAPDRGKPYPPPQRLPQPLQEALKNGETLRIVLREEQIRVEKYPVVKEEVLISKRQIEETKHFSDTLKREEIHIERMGKVPLQENDGNTV